MSTLPHNLLHELLDAIHWDAFSEDDTTLEIDRKVAEKIKVKVSPTISQSYEDLLEENEKLRLALRTNVTVLRSL